MAVKTGNVTSGIADFLASYLAGKSAAQKDAVDKAFQQQNTEAGFYAGTRAEDLQRQIAANNMSQQDPFTQFNALQKQNERMDLASGQDVGPKYRTASVMPGIEKFGEIPQLSFNYGSNFKAAQTPQNLAREYANSQIRQKQVSPDSPTSNMGGLFGSAIGQPYDDEISAASAKAKAELEASKGNQLGAIRRAADEAKKGTGVSAGGALGSALLGGLGGLAKGGADMNLDPVAKFIGDLIKRAQGKQLYDPSTPQGQQQAPWDPSGAYPQPGEEGWVEGTPYWYDFGDLTFNPYDLPDFSGGRDLNTPPPELPPAIQGNPFGQYYDPYQYMRW